MIVNTESALGVNQFLTAATHDHQDSRLRRTEGSIGINTRSWVDGNDAECWNGRYALLIGRNYP